MTDLDSGRTRQIRSPLGFGFDYGGGFSADGRQLAVFANTKSGTYNPETRLALLDVATGSLRFVPGATIEIGESIGWAQWLPGTSQLIGGGLCGPDEFRVNETELLPGRQPDAAQRTLAACGRLECGRELLDRRAALSAAVVAGPAPITSISQLLVLFWRVRGYLFPVRPPYTDWGKSREHRD